MKASATTGIITFTIQFQIKQLTFIENYLFCVMPGNYPATMRTVMTKRGNWSEV